MEIEIFPGYLIITVTENQTTLWSISLTGGENLDQDSKDAVFYQLSLKYVWLSNKKEKQEFLDELEKIILPRLSIGPMHRKSLIRKLRESYVKEARPKPLRGRKPKYNDFDKHHLVQLWRLSGYPCTKRLKALLPEWLNDYECSDQVKKHLTSMSASQMDIYLKEARADYYRKVASGTIPSKNHIKQIIKLRDPSIRYIEPGYMETDTVLHCGHYIWGVYAHTVSLTDLYSGWTEGRGIYGKNAKNVVTELKGMKARLPFAMLALFFDNGIEYVNHLLVQELKENEELEVARGRAGKKNDQCHIEQKNHTFVRQIFGNVRIESPDLIPLMNEIYDIWGKLHNYFMPQMKLIEKDRVGGKVKKKYDKPKTPYQRIMECPTVSEEVKEKLRKEKETLNPFKLQAELQEKLALFHKLNDAYNEKHGKGVS